MLTEDQKAAIVAEERFRHDVRQRLASEEPPPSRSAKLWAALNSSFFLWCMSSVVVSAIAFSYQQFAANRDARAARAVSINRLDAEISTRLGYFASQVNKGIPEKTALTALNEPATVNLANCAFAEYAARTLHMLMRELHELAPVEEQPPIRAAMKSLQVLVATDLLQGSERYLSAEFTLEVNVSGRGKMLEDFFGDIDAASTSAGPSTAGSKVGNRSEGEQGVGDKALPQPAAQAKDDFPSFDERSIFDDVLKDMVRITASPGRPESQSGPVHITLDVSVFHEDPEYKRTAVIHVVAFDPANPMIAALNIDRWGQPFSGNTAELLAQARAKLAKLGL